MLLDQSFFSVLPIYMGMIPRRNQYRVTAPSAPHIHGDDSSSGFFKAFGSGCSPYTC